MNIVASLIPEQWIADLAGSEWALWLIAVGAIALLVVGAGAAVNAAAKLAAVLGMSKLIIGATVVSLGTTAPEACVSVMAAWRGNAGLALGNGMGSIICNTALIFGLCCVLKRMPLNRFLLNRQGWVQFGSGVLLAGTMLLLWAAAGGDLSRVVIGRSSGLVFLTLLVGYMFLSVRWSRQHRELIPDEAGLQMKDDHRGYRLLGNLAALAVGLAMVVFGSDVLVVSAVQICRNHAVPETVIAGTFIAFGTSLPELVTAITALVKGHSELSVGNIVGANILNVLFVVGAAATARPLNVDAAAFYLMMPTMLGALVLLRLYITFSGASFRRWQGAPLLAAYVVFVLLSVFKFGGGIG